jgi:chromosome segregation ATPase
MNNLVPTRTIGSLARLPGLALAPLRQLELIADATRAIPELGRQLALIAERVEALDREVTRMRKGVDSIGNEVVGVRESVGPLDTELRRVQQEVGRLDGPLSEVRDALGPIQQTAERLNRLGRLPGGARRRRGVPDGSDPAA